ncbi:hypothetical protein [Actinospica sp.]|uniref:hypothetical protein n=1 Tax=Actinospica sp. TaxID=1872142 RepID=UPI002B591567|nr:hypothetical protein [Actinospica sp.]HWG26296.1 hypothetical protein [Actinospica sp.]
MTGTTPSARLATAPRFPALRPLAGGVASGRRRTLQLVLAGIWLLDGVLQFQPAMFTKNFAQMVIYPTIGGNPSVIASPMNRVHAIVLNHPVGTDTAFACIQVAVGLAIAYRPTAKLGLAASIPWSLAVWWFGEGLGGVLSGKADPLTGAPGAVILYALLAVLLWPVDEDDAVAPAPFEAARFVGARTARALWLVLWGSLVYFTFASGNDAPGALAGQVTTMVDGQPGWLASIMNHAANLTNGRDLAISIVIGVLLAAIAVSVYLPWPRARRGWLVAAFVFSAVIWVVVQAFGGVFLGMATDPNSGPLLALVALAYWPVRAARQPSTDPTTNRSAR